VFYVLNGAAALAAAIATLELGARQIEPPGEVLGAADLGVDEPVDAFVTDGCRRFLLAEPAGDLLGGPAVLQAAEDEVAERNVTLEFGSGPSAGPGLFLSVGRFIADFGAAVAFQFARDGRWRAIQSCRDLAERLPVFMKTGNRTPFLEREVVVLLGHCNTLPWCCTSFVNSGDPGSRSSRGHALGPRFRGDDNGI